MALHALPRPRVRTIADALAEGRLPAADAEVLIRRERARYLGALARHGLARVAARITVPAVSRGPVTPRAA